MSYQQDLAYVHHTGYGSFAENAARELIPIIQKQNIHNGLILDLGCGSGITSRIFTDYGAEVRKRIAFDSIKALPLQSF